MPIKAVHGLVEASPLRVILLTFLLDAEHGGEKHSVGRCLRIGYVEKCNAVLLNATLCPLQSLV